MIIAVALFTLAVSAVLPVVAVYYASANDLITNFILDVIRFGGSLKFSHVVVNQYTAVDAFIFYLFMIMFLYAFFRFNRFMPKLILTVMLFFNVFLYTSLDDKELLPENVLSIFMIDIGQGDSYLIKKLNYTSPPKEK